MRGQKPGGHLPSRHAAPTVFVTLLLVACSEMNAPKPVTTGVPAVVAHSIAVDYDARVGTLSLTAADPDTLVGIQCEGAFVGAGSNTVTIIRPFAELRHHRFLNTTCTLAAAGDSPVHVGLSETPEVSLDSSPTVGGPVPAEPPRVNTPVLFTMSAVDDWGIASHWIYYARGDDINQCAANWVRARTTELAVAAREVIETITLTFSEPGHYCIGFATRDDFDPLGPSSGHVSGANNYIEVTPE
jgi:hypothetical protein